MPLLKDKNVLIAEDEAFIAFDLRRLLGDLGARIVGPASTLADAGALLDEEEVDAAILDVNLNGEMSFPLVRKLNAGKVPLLFITGYDEWSLPEEFRALPRLSKPFSTTEAATMIRQLFTAGGQRC